MAGYSRYWALGAYGGPNAVAVARTVGVPASEVTIFDDGQGVFVAPAAAERAVAADARDLAAQREGWAQTQRSMGRQRSQEELSGLQLSQSRGRTLLTIDGRTWTYRGGELSYKNRMGKTVSGDLGSLAERVYGSHVDHPSRRLEAYIESKITGGAADRRRNDMQTYGRARRAA